MDKHIFFGSQQSGFLVFRFFSRAVVVLVSCSKFRLACPQSGAKTRWGIRQVKSCNNEKRSDPISKPATAVCRVHETKGPKSCCLCCLKQPTAASLTWPEKTAALVSHCGCWIFGFTMIRIHHRWIWRTRFVDTYAFNSIFWGLHKGIVGFPDSPIPWAVHLPLAGETNFWLHGKPTNYKWFSYSN